jgi:hypothetical protein
MSWQERSPKMSSFQFKTKRNGAFLKKLEAPNRQPEAIKKY